MTCLALKPALPIAESADAGEQCGVQDVWHMNDLKMSYTSAEDLFLK
jgi:hypothetical protein